MPDHTVLIVDDEPDIRELLEITLGRMGLNTLSAANLQQARQLLEENQVELCLTDMRLPDGNGIDLVAHIQEHYPNIPAAVITAHGNVETAVAALKAGAFDFISKPVDLQNLRDLVAASLRLGKLEQQTPRANAGPQLLGQSKVMENLRHTIKKLARSQAPVYIHGESGTGKEMVAQLIHTEGPRSDAPFVPVNCGAIPAELMESEFFGHKKGSFTGAASDKQGLFQAAEGGTLFLDEVAELPLAMQVKLLRAIQEKAIRPVGAATEIPVNARILSASHKDLAKEVDENRFRQDLFYRINVIEVKVPSLRERGGDVLVLAEHVLKKLTRDYSHSAPSLSEDARAALVKHPFPGNVRELENTLERALALCESHTITLNDLQLPKSEKPKHTSEPEVGTTFNQRTNNHEKDMLVEALEKTRWNKSAAAEMLGMSYRQLRYRVKKLGIG